MMCSVLRERWNSMVETNEAALALIASGELRIKSGDGDTAETVRLLHEVNAGLRSLIEHCSS